MTDTIEDQKPTAALAVQPGQGEWTVEQLAALRSLGIEEAEPADLAIFLSYAQRTGLDPFARQIYMIGRWDSRKGRNKWTIQTSIDGARVVAQRSGQYAGQTPAQWCAADGVWRDVWLSTEHPAAARIGVYRAGFVEPLYAVARWDSYWPGERGGQMWAKMPDVMIAKVAEALALRKAFPHDLANIYVAEEMEQADASNLAGQHEQRTAAEEANREALIVNATSYRDTASTMPGDRDGLKALWADAKADGLLDVPVDGKALGAWIIEYGQQERVVEGTVVEDSSETPAESTDAADPVDEAAPVEWPDAVVPGSEEGQKVAARRTRAKKAEEGA